MENILNIKTQKIIAYLNDLLKPWSIKDYAPNGLQVEGKSHVSKIITGVTASEALIDAAIAEQADAILVHHGYFWKSEEPTIVGMKKQRLKKLLAQDINLLAYHLPLDIHPELGNNAQLAKLLDIQIQRPLEPWNQQSVALKGRFKEPISGEALSQRIFQCLGRTPLYHSGYKEKISTVAWCTGGGQHFIELAASQGIDAFITGEVSEQTIHVSREMGIHFFAAGHHATERYGVKALGEHLAAHFDIEVIFVDIDNPA